MKKLSICIPTYNRIICLEELLITCILQIETSGLEGLVQISISDNCSTDTTKNVVEQLQKSHPAVEIIFSINEENIGADRNYIQCVAISTAEYCWIMGSDDQIASNGIENVLHSIDANDSVVLIGNRIACDFKMKPMFKEYWLSKNQNKTFLFSSDAEISELFLSIPSTTAMFGYLSVIILRREAWMSVQDYDQYLDTAYVHVYILLKSLYNWKGKITYFPEYITLSRFGNDSFHESLGQRIMLDFKGYSKISQICSTSEQQKKFRSILVRQYNTVFLRALQLSAPNLSNEDKEILYNVGYPTKTLNHIFKKRSKLFSYLGLFGSMIKFFFTDPVRFMHTVEISIQKLKKSH